MLPVTAPVINVEAVLAQIAVILAVGLLLKVLSDRLKTPFIVALILAGTLLASAPFFNIESMGFLPGLIRVLALIIIVFVNGFYIRLDSIKKESSIVIPLATIGVVLTALILTAITYFVLGLPLLAAAFMGALLSGTDPAAISNMLKEKGGRLQTIINSESILNQPLTVILPLLLFDFVMAGETPIPILVGFSLGKLILLAGVGILIGLLGFFLGQRILDMLQSGLEEIAGIMIAVGVYVLAESLGGSGILAVGITSVLLNSSKVPKKQSFTEFNKELALLFTVFVFVLLGMQFSIQELAEMSITRLDLITMLFAVVAARFITVMAVTYKSNLSMHERISLGLISPKGMAPAALAPLVFTMAAVNPALVSMDSALAVVKIVYLTIIISVLVAILTFKATRK